MEIFENEGENVYLHVITYDEYDPPYNPWDKISEHDMENTWKYF